ncbi:MAG: hypothetical protein RLO51_22520 [Thalassobaculum sp.]|uniref:hypothetical protein n=1 Tax=Thalassobaculum sp. TaxID=2022740 RepID=UPI0032ED0E2D
MPGMTRKKWLLAGAAAVVVIGTGVGLVLRPDGCDICQAANDILLQGSVAQNCTVDVTTEAAAGSLPLTTAGAQRVQVGTVLQNCNKKVGYTLAVTSANCAAAPTGAKVVDSVSTEYLAYSGEFANPTTGGSTASVTGLLASACAGQTGRDVTNAKIISETSTVFVNFTGNTGLAAGTYQDTLTITMNVK